MTYYIFKFLLLDAFQRQLKISIETYKSNKPTVIDNFI